MNRQDDESGQVVDVQVSFALLPSPIMELVGQVSTVLKHVPYISV